jgi:putative tricarboxylic transport membrane protein
MARQGRAGEALGLGIFASFFGGLVGAAVLVIFLKPMAEFGLEFGPWELFSLVLFSLTLIASLGGQSFFKGLFGGFLGLSLAMIGMDHMGGTLRLTFGFPELNNGLSLLPVLVGLFGLPHLVKGLGAASGGGSESTGISDREIRIPYGKVLREIRANWWNILRSGLIGSFVGALPGEGGSVANFLSYDQAKRYSRRGAEFGTGCSEGVVASEAGNNGTAGGAMIPTLTLGIPGSASTAVMLGVLMVHSIPPGPGLFKGQPMLIYGLFVSFIIAHFFMLLIQLGAGSRFFLRIASIPQYLLIPAVLLMCAIGSFALNNRMFDIWIFFAFGMIGYIMDKADYPLAPVIIGLILGSMCEVNLRQALSTDPEWMLFFTRPISLAFLVLTVLSSVISLVQTRKGKKGLKGILGR